MKSSSSCRTALPRRLVVCAAAAVGLAAAAALAVSPPPVYRTVNLTGQQVPGGAPGVVFEFPSAPRIGDSGWIVFWARLGGPTATDPKVGSIWSVSPEGVLGRLAMNLDPTPFDPALMFTTVTDPIMTPSGEVVFTGTFAATPNPPGTTPITSGFFRAGGSGVEDLQVRDGLAAPELPLTPAELVGLTTTALSPTGLLGLTSNSGQALWRLTASGRELLAARTMLPPNQPPQFIYRDLDGPAIDDSGGVLFRAVLHDPAVPLVIKPTLYVDREGVTELLYEAGDPAPGAGPGLDFADFSPRPVLTPSGKTFFTGLLAGDGIGYHNNHGIWSDRTGSMALLVREGDAAPGLDAGITLTGLPTRPVVNNRGDMAIVAHLLGGEPAVTAANNSGMWVYPRTGAPRLIAREGDQVPGMSEGIRFAVIQEPAISDRGQLAFLARLRGDAGSDLTPSTNFALLTTDRCGNIIPVVRTGQLFTVHPPVGDPLVKTVAEIVFEGEAAGQGRGQINWNGTVAFTLMFTDRSFGLFTATTYLRADVNQDGEVDSRDISAFITLWLADVTNGTTLADFNDDGSTDSTDISAFITRWVNTVNGGC